MTAVISSTAHNGIFGPLPISPFKRPMRKSIRGPNSFSNKQKIKFKIFLAASENGKFN
jgi:hypothetical protein